MVRDKREPAAALKAGQAVGEGDDLPLVHVKSAEARGFDVHEHGCSFEENECTSGVLVQVIRETVLERLGSRRKRGLVDVLRALQLDIGRRQVHVLDLGNAVSDSSVWARVSRCVTASTSLIFAPMSPARC